MLFHKQLFAMIRHVVTFIFIYFETVKVSSTYARSGIPHLHIRPIQLCSSGMVKNCLYPFFFIQCCIISLPEFNSLPDFELGFAWIIMAMPVGCQWNQQLQDQLQALIDELPRYLYFISIFLVWCLLMYECFLSRIVPHELLFEAIKSYYKLKRFPPWKEVNFSQKCWNPPWKNPP